MFLVMEPADASVNHANPVKTDDQADALRAGVYVHASRYRPPIGYSKIDLFLTKIPSQRLFDVRSARFQSASNDVVQYFTVSHPTALRGSRPICAGLFTVYAHNPVHFWEGLTFGGAITITSHHQYTHIEVESLAPIMVLMGDADPIQHVLFDEIMVTIARHRAECHETDSQFAHHLASADPYKLFLAALTTLQMLARQGAPSMSGSEHLEIQRTVQRMITSVRNTDGWPDNVPMLESML